MDVEISNRNPEKFIPHPILDDPNKMMRIIANPVYDKLTISRAGHMRKYHLAEYSRKLSRVSRPNEKTMITPVKSVNSEQTIITSLPTNNNQSPLKVPSRRQSSRTLPLIAPSPVNRISQKYSKLSNHSRNNSIHSSLLEHDKKPATDSNLRYVNSHFGFEVQRYSSPNWLSIDLLTKDACASEEKTFREMIDKKEQNESLSRSIYSSEYYRQRWEDLLASYKEGHLTHDQWARQNYQLNCLKIFYKQACEREQNRLNSFSQNQRQRRAESVFNQWKEAKVEGNIERPHSHLNTANSYRTTEVTSVLSNDSSSLPNHTINRASISSIQENNFEELPLFRPINLSKHPTNISKTSYMLDEQRWSLKAMLKRVVGLAEPLPPPPPSKVMDNRYSSVTVVSNDSGFESGH